MPQYTGRFAPSPTGPLHFGSLLAALASYLDARASDGRWLVRMEDIDPPREMPGAASLILRQLEAHGLVWDGPVLYQSQRAARYESVITRLLEQGDAYYCRCSRSDLKAMGGTYDGRCRGRGLPRRGNALRVQVPPGTDIDFEDIFQGAQHSALDRDVGDFVVLRRDGYYAYQLAVAVDDADQGVSHVIRGSDLLDSTFRQRFLLERLGWVPPVYGHIPVAVNRQGQKLSKQNLARSLNSHKPEENLYRALEALGIPASVECGGMDAQGLLAWAVGRWRRDCVPGGLAIPAPEDT